jgi:hypothetical protein
MERERFADELEEVAWAIADDNEEYIEELLNKEEE